MVLFVICFSGHSRVTHEWINYQVRLLIACSAEINVGRLGIDSYGKDTRLRLYQYSCVVA